MESGWPAALPGFASTVPVIAHVVPCADDGTVVSLPHTPNRPPRSGAAQTPALVDGGIDGVSAHPAAASRTSQPRRTRGLATWDLLSVFTGPPRGSAPDDRDGIEVIPRSRAVSDGRSNNQIGGS